MKRARLTRNDLRGFDQASRDLLLNAQDQGARIRITRNGHAVVHGPYGLSTTVAPNLTYANRTAKNAKAGIARVLRKPKPLV